MMIRLTSDKKGLGVTLRADCILFCRRDPETQLTTHVVTNIMGPSGLQAFHVQESPEQVALMVNAAMNTAADPKALGLSPTSTITQQ